MSRRDALPEKDWVAIADLGSTCGEVLLARYDDEALADGYIDKKADELIRGAKVAIRAARKLQRRATEVKAAVVAEQIQNEEVVA